MPSGRNRGVQALPESFADIKIMYYVDGSKKEDDSEGGSAAIMFIKRTNDRDWREAKRITSKVITDTLDINYMGASRITNNTAELQAMCMALRDAANYRGRILIRYDSKYAYGVTTREMQDQDMDNIAMVTMAQQYYDGAKNKERRRMRRTTLESIMQDQIQIVFEHVQGHSEEVFNDRVDHAAKSAIGKEYEEKVCIENLQQYEILNTEEELGEDVVWLEGAEEKKDGYEEEDRGGGVEENKNEDSDVNRGDLLDSQRLADQMRDLQRERMLIQREKRRQQLNSRDEQVDDTNEDNMKCRVCNKKCSMNWDRHCRCDQHTNKVENILRNEFEVEVTQRTEEEVDREIEDNRNRTQWIEEDVDRRNYPKNCHSIDMNIEDVEWTELGSLQAIGHAPETRLRLYSLLLREALLLVIPGIVARPTNLQLWKRLFLIPIIMASEMNDKKKNKEWKLKKLKEDDWSEFRLSEFKGKFNVDKKVDRHKSKKEVQQHIEKLFQSNMNRGYLSKAVQVVNRQHQHTKTGEEKFNNLVSKYIVDSDRQTELIVTHEMVRQ